MDSKAFDLINNMLESEVYRINYPFGIIETKEGGFPVLYDGRSVQVCNVLCKLNSEDQRLARETLGAFNDALISRTPVKVSAGEELRGKRVELLIDDLIAQSEEALKFEFDKALVADNLIRKECRRYGALGMMGARTAELVRVESRGVLIRRKLGEAQNAYEQKKADNRAIAQLFFERYGKRSFKNEGEVLKHYDSVSAAYHTKEQRKLFFELSQISEMLVRQAREKRDGVLVFPGRSLIACADYIEEKYPDIKVIKIPLSQVDQYEHFSKFGMVSHKEGRHVKARALKNSEIDLAISSIRRSGDLPEALRSEILEPVDKSRSDFECRADQVQARCNSYLDDYLSEVKDKNLILVDYTASGKGLKNFADMVESYSGSRQLTKIAVFANGKAAPAYIRQPAEVKSVMTSLGFDRAIGCFPKENFSNTSRLESILINADLDGFSPYGKHTLENIVRGITVKGVVAEDYDGVHAVRAVAGQAVALSSTFSDREKGAKWEMIT
ncbi:hypothetical protein [Endozoicomonas elysicola]|uniref:Uncharacterized protein n=1 Tax=Endozoicomonas elysicola TaxID=305900 RepID=A0A081KFE5_9GAMM|nr:hypothetical protein [Endozoicomonas elysicola]KEI72871.1 hypothetical protein GV64_21010 [Endozoicomonas elysicola]